MKGLKQVLLTVGILCSLVLNSDAQVNWSKFPYFQNWGGLNDQQSTTEINDNEATDIQNIVFDLGGALKKRFGYDTLDGYKVASGTTLSVNGLSFYQLDSGSKYLVALCSRDSNRTVMAKSYSVSGSLNAGWTCIDGVVPAGGSYTNTYVPQFTTAENKIVFCFGDSSPIYMWGATTGVVRLTTDPDCPTTVNLVCYHKNQLFISGNSSFPSRVYFSELDDMGTWTPTDFFDVQTSDGSQVRALLSAYDALYIFKDYSIWRLSGWERDSFRLEKMVDGMGTLSKASPVATNRGIYFISKTNEIFHYDGNYTVTNISTKVSQTTAGTNRLVSDRALGIGFSSYRQQDKDYYTTFAVGAESVNSEVLLFDTLYNAWTKLKGNDSASPATLQIKSWCVADNEDGGNSLFFGDYNGWVHQYPSTSFHDSSISTTAIASFYQTKWFRYPEVGLGDKYWRLIKVYALSQDGVTVYAECKADYEASGKVLEINLTPTSAKWDSAKWDDAIWGGTTVIVGRQEVEKGVSMFQTRFYNTELDQGFTILGYENFVEPSGRI